MKHAPARHRANCQPCPSLQAAASAHAAALVGGFHALQPEQVVPAPTFVAGLFQQDYPAVLSQQNKGKVWGLWLGSLIRASPFRPTYVVVARGEGLGSLIRACVCNLDG